MTSQEIEEIFFTAYDGNFDIIKMHLDNGISPNIQNEDGKTLLHVACDDGYSGLLELLLEHGADPNVEDNDGDTPIDYATYRNYNKYIQILKEHGAIVRVRKSAVERNWQLINEAQEQVRVVQNLSTLIEKNKTNLPK